MGLQRKGQLLRPQFRIGANRLWYRGINEQRAVLNCPFVQVHPYRIAISAGPRAHGPVLYPGKQFVRVPARTTGPSTPVCEFEGSTSTRLSGVKDTIRGTANVPAKVGGTSGVGKSWVPKPPMPGMSTCPR